MTETGTSVERFDPDKSLFPILFDADEGGIREVLTENFGDEGLRGGDLDRVKIPAAGGRHWDIPEEEPTTVLEGIVVHKQKTRSYWIKDVDEGDGTGSPPDCASADGILGNGAFGPGSEGNPTGQCEKCPMNAFGSGKGDGKACKEQMQLFLLRPHSVLPTQVTLPPTSLKPWRKYMTRLASKGMSFYGVVTRLGLTQEKGPAGPYSVAVPTRGDELAPAEKAAAKAYGIAIAGSVSFTVRDDGLVANSVPTTEPIDVEVTDAPRADAQ